MVGLISHKLYNVSNPILVSYREREREREREIIKLVDHKMNGSLEWLVWC